MGGKEGESRFIKTQLSIIIMNWRSVIKWSVFVYKIARQGRAKVINQNICLFLNALDLSNVLVSESPVSTATQASKLKPNLNNFVVRTSTHQKDS